MRICDMVSHIRLLEPIRATRKVMRIIKLLAVLFSIGIIGYLGYVAYFVFSPEIENFKNRTEFNSELWKNWEDTEASASLRWDMTHSLTTNFELIGMSSEQVIELLGQPSGRSNSELRYYLGMSRHWIDTGSLVLELEEGKVVNYRIWHG
ncbi:hypothetical protein BGP76_13250 [Reichenbachiella sp. MSK19-1]|nr:hypothetical protein BGP76_13250 [Reichenbachiella sp. MSK19-1]